MAEALLFDATWLYDGQGHSKLCTTQAEYESMMAQGWQDTPAAFGIETHPMNPVQSLEMGSGAMLQQLGVPAPFSPSQNWDDAMAMLQQMQASMDGYAAQLAKMMDRLEVVELALFEPAEKAPEPSADKGKK